MISTLRSARIRNAISRLQKKSEEYFAD